MNSCFCGHLLLSTGFLRRVGQPKVLFKPVQGGVKGVREVSFYDVLHGVRSGLGHPDMFPGLSESVQQSEEQVRVLKDILPRYYGLESIADRSGKSSILCRERRRVLCVRVCVCVSLTLPTSRLPQARGYHTPV